jgi:aspartate oxidase
MTANVGVLRDAVGLERAAGELRAIDRQATGTPQTPGTPGTPDVDAAGLRALSELRSLITVGRAVAAAALDREESRGAHHRLDHPEPAREAERVVHLGGGRRVRVPVTLARELER